MFRFVVVGFHGEVFTHGDDAESFGIFVGFGGDNGEVGAESMVLFECGAEVHLIEVIRAEHDHGVCVVAFEQWNLLVEGVPVTLGKAVLIASFGGREDTQAVAGAVQIPGAVRWRCAG